MRATCDFTDVAPLLPCPCGGVSVVPTSWVFSQVYPLNEVNFSGDFILA